MEAELLTRIERVQKRRCVRAVVLGLVLPILLGMFAVAVFSKTYIINVTPGLFPDAVSDVATLQGTGVQIGRRYLLLSGEAELEFSYRGHWPSRQALSKKSVKTVVVGELQPMAKKVELVTNPEIEVTWMVAGELAAFGRRATLTLPPNQSIDIEVLGPFGRVVKESVEIDWREQAPPKRVISVSHWELALNSEPVGASVSSGGNELGETPLRFFPNQAFEEITLSKPGYQSETLNLVSWIRSDEPATPFVLSPSAKDLPAILRPEKGSLLGAVLSSDGKSITPTALPPTKVTYAKAGYVPQTLLINDSTKSVDIRLQPAVGTLSLLEPAGGTALISNLGEHPIPSDVILPIGDHRLVISSDGFRSTDRKVSILQDEVTLVSQTLETLEAFRIRTAPDRVRAPHDIYLTKISPDSIVLGAPRSQRGQRANELIRQVEFSRQFYMSETEISDAQFAQYLGKARKSKLPVTGISWDAAALFCNYLSKQHGLPVFYKERNGRVVGWYSESIGYRLPTEAEWEFVATKYKKRQESIFTWGDDYDVPDSGFGNIADKSADGKAKRFIADRSDGYAGLAPVGISKQAGAISDLSGNVSEWVHDYYSITIPAVAPLHDYQGPSKGRQHFVKGSNYLSSSWTELRGSYREPIDAPREDVGFRIARYVH